VAVDADDNVYVADTTNHKIRKITPAGVVTTLAGAGTIGSADGASGVAQFFGPNAVAVDSAGNVYVADTNNNRIRKVTPAGVVSTLAGSTFGFADGTGAAAKFNEPFGVAVDGAGNVYVADSQNFRVRKVTPAGVVTTLAGAANDFADGVGTSARFSLVYGIAIDTAGTIYVADGNHVVRRIK
jgi:sugar lactone lactonase YvrE